jgi:hypothetical protein
MHKRPGRWVGRGGREVRGEVTQTMYIHVSRCRNNKTKGEKKSTKELE